MRRASQVIGLVCVAAALVAGAVPAAAVRGGGGPAAGSAVDPTSGAPTPDRGGLPELDLARPAGGTGPAAGDRAGDPRQVLVRFAGRTTPAQEQSALVAAGTVTDEVPGTGFVVVAVGDRDPDDVVAVLETDPRVVEAQVDHVRAAAGWTSDPLVDEAWPYLDLVRLPRAWDLSRGAGTVIAVLDTGVDAGHEDLAGSVLPGIDLVNADSDPADDNGHGTFVAGIAAAHGNNAVGAVGAAYAASVLPVKVLDGSGAGADSDIAQGITYAADQGADVINLSFAGPDESPILLAAIEYAVAKGSFVATAAGNDGTQAAQYPAAYAPQVDGLVAVGQTDDDGDLYESSWGDWVSVAAPGFKVIGPQLGGDYAYGYGTSFSTPLVSGVAALVRSAGATATPADIERQITSSARDAGPRGIDPYYGRGVLDAAGALGLGTAIPLDRAGDPTDAGDMPATAQPLGAGGASATGTLSPQGDADWYRFDPPAPGWYTVTVTPSLAAAIPLDPILVARDADGGVLGYADDQWVNRPESFVVAAPTAGPILVGVTNADGSAADTSQYTVTVSPYGARVRFENRYDWSNFTGGPVAVGDFTGDGLVDAVVADSSTAVHLYPGLGNGSFGSPLSVPVGGNLVREPAAVTDVDLDGDLDVVVSTTAGLQVLVQDGGTLRLGSTVPLAGGAWAIEAADMDADGDPDLVVSASATTALYTNDGTGAFVRGAGFAGWLAGMAVGDVSGDGRPDVVAGDGRVFIQASGATFGAPFSLPGGGFDVAVGDVTGDGLPDVVRTVRDSPGEVIVTPLRVDGTFGPGATYPAGDHPGPVEIGDVDGDGRSDVVVANGGTTVSVLLQEQNGSLAAPEATSVAYETWRARGRLALTDLDADGHLDVVLAGNGVTALRQWGLDAPPADRGWFDAVNLAPHAAGVGVRPTIRLTARRDLQPVSVSAATVRLIDGVSGTDVASTRGYDPVSGDLWVTPTADLVAGGHYQVNVSGLTAASDQVQPETFRTWFTVAAGGDRFTPVEPRRVLDTRVGAGVPKGRVRPGAPIRLSLGGVEVPADATAVVINVTAVKPSSRGNVRVYPTPSAAGAAPTISSLNVVAGIDQPNLVTVALGAGGRVTLATDGVTADLVGDLAGYYGPGAATAYVPVDPRRVLDLRDGTGGVRAGRLAAGHWVDLTVTGRAGVPREASAVVLNVTGVAPQGRTNVRVYPTPAAFEDQAPPAVSNLNLQGGRDQANLNLQGGRDQANLVTVVVGDAGRVRFYTQSASLWLVADVAGYYAPTGDHGFVPLAPVRVADTRDRTGLTGGVLRAGAVADLAVAGLAGVPVTADAAVLNVTAVAPRGRSNVRVYPTMSPVQQPPLVSSLNVVMGRDEANLTISRLGAQGRLSFYTQTADLDLAVDVSGYFTR